MDSLTFTPTRNYLPQQTDTSGNKRKREKASSARVQRRKTQQILSPNTRLTKRLERALSNTTQIQLSSPQKENSLLGKGGHNEIRRHPQQATPKKNPRAVKQGGKTFSTTNEEYIFPFLASEWNSEHTAYTINEVGRNTAAYRISKLLGLNLVVQSRPATFHEQKVLAMKIATGESPEQAKWKQINDKVLESQLKQQSSIQETRRGRLGECYFKLKYPVMRETGFYAIKYDAEGKLWGGFKASNPKINFEDPLLRKQLSQLSIYHCLVRMVDGHFGNMLFDFDNDGKFTGLKSYDYDMSCVAGDGTLEEAHKLPWTYFPGVPNVIDKETLEAIHRANPGHIISCCKDTGLTIHEQATLAQALLCLQEHYSESKKGSSFIVIEKDEDWGSKAVAEKIYEGEGYLARLTQFYKMEHGQLPAPLENKYVKVATVIADHAPIVGHKNLPTTAQEEPVEDLQSTVAVSVEEEYTPTQIVDLDTLTA
tara:strand:- start:56034 stop:57476 length:1443 start_codon:yes stop_codon:yes gene_type:complete